MLAVTSHHQHSVVVIVDTAVTNARIMVLAYGTHLKHDTLYYLADIIAFTSTLPLIKCVDFGPITSCISGHQYPGQ